MKEDKFNMFVGIAILMFVVGWLLTKHYINLVVMVVFIFCWMLKELYCEAKKK